MIDGINGYTTTNLDTFMNKKGHRRQSQGLITGNLFNTEAMLSDKFTLKPLRPTT
jgi:hypothetical protein